ncbi:iron ABC transporter permease [candidate division NPL-UPA2 bacterium]|nr:iron ABC transporter permease [candidate division NPL-UPA2 bacterium]
MDLIKKKLQPGQKKAVVCAEIEKANRKKIMYILVFAFFLLFITVFSVSLGTVPFTISEIVSGLTGRSENALANIIIFNVRLPRILLGLLVGMNLAVAGGLLQGLLRNPLAAPQVIGVNAGAGLAAVAIMVLFPELFLFIPLAAFMGAIAVTFLVYLLSEKEGKGSTVSIILAGIAISALLRSITSGLMFLFSDRLEVTFAWLLGGLIGRGWRYFHLLVPYSLIGLIAALFLSPKVNLLLLGEDASRSLGLPVKMYRALIIIVASILAASAVSVAGTIGFIGLVAPHIARLMVGNDYRYLTALSAIIGALIVVVSDNIARLALQPLELPVGIITAMLGAPFFLWLLYKKRKQIGI